RFSRDWSSDVCSSDLNKHIAFLGDTIKCFNENIIKNITMIATGDGSLESGTKILIAIGILIGCLNPNDTVQFRKSVLHDLGVFRSEERRVGKECRARL